MFFAVLERIPVCRGHCVSREDSQYQASSRRLEPFALESYKAARTELWTPSTSHERLGGLPDGIAEKKRAEFPRGDDATRVNA